MIPAVLVFNATSMVLRQFLLQRTIHIMNIPNRPTMDHHRTDPNMEHRRRALAAAADQTDTSTNRHSSSYE